LIGLIVSSINAPPARLSPRDVSVTGMSLSSCTVGTY